MQRSPYGKKDVDLVMQMLRDRNNRLEDRKTLEVDLKQAEELLAGVKAEYTSRESYAPILDMIADALGAKSEGPTKQDVLELEETVEYYVELRKHNEARLNELFELQARLHEREPELLRFAESQLKVEEQPEKPEFPTARAALSEEEVSSLFNIEYLREQIIPWMDNVNIIVDGYNVIGRVPRYNYRVQEAKLGECRDRLINDLDYLRSQTRASWCVVFDTIHRSTQMEVRGIRVVFPEGSRKTLKESGDDRVVAEAAELKNSGANVFVVTNDRELSSRVSDVGARALSIGEVFKY